MQIVRETIALRQLVADWRRAGERIALVPTMGALHAGHMALIEAGKVAADRVIASIFVNPLQFGPSEDLDRYPRTEDADAALLERHGADAVWMPGVGDLYPEGFATSVTVTGVSDRWDGEARPGHFAGVATVVAKLLIAVQPDVALFGEKDFQQLAVIRRMVTDLGLPVEIVGVATVRDGDGIALSSRNAYLSADERARALALPRALDEARAAIESGEHILVSTLLAVARAKLTAAGFGKVDYLALVDAGTLDPVDHATGEMRLIAAATIGKTRLIDNVRVQMATARREG